MLKLQGDNGKIKRNIGSNFMQNNAMIAEDVRAEKMKIESRGY